VIASAAGRAVRFNEKGVRPMGRTAAGVRGINLNDPDNKVIGMVCISREDAQLLVLSENGFGKRSAIDSYRVTNRGGKGVSTMNATDKVGKLVAIREVTEEDDLMIITRNGIAIRMSVLDIRQAGRNTQGVKLIRLSSSDEITSVTRILKDPDEKAEELDEDGNVVAKPVAQVEGASADDVIVSDDELDEEEDVADDDEEEDEEPSDDAEA